MKCALCTILIAVAVFLCVGVSYSQDIIWRAERSKHFIVYYSGHDKKTAVRAGAIAEKWHTILSEKLEFSPGQVTPINLYPDRRSFSKATGVAERDNVVGMAHGRMVSISVDASGMFTDIERIIPHELVHVFVSRRLRDRTSDLPLWMHEGLAKYLAGDWSGPDAELLADAASSGRLYSFADIASSFPNNQEGRGIAYVESYAAVRYMAEKYTEKCLPDLLSEMADGRSFGAALKYSTGVEADKFESEWREYMWEKYNVGRWIKFVSALIYALMALTAVLAFRARMKAKRRKAEEFDEEDESSSETDEFQDFS